VPSTESLTPPCSHVTFTIAPSTTVPLDHVTLPVTDEGVIAETTIANDIKIVKKTVTRINLFILTPPTIKKKNILFYK
jgi:hypothetical protein